MVLLLLSYFAHKISNFILRFLMPLMRCLISEVNLWFNLQFRNACVGRDFSMISLLEIFVGKLDITSSYRSTGAVALDTFLV